MFLDPRADEGITHHLISFGTHETTTIRHLQESQVLQPGDVVLDIGANIGYFALLEAQLVGTEGRVYALEPVQDSFKRLKNNIARNNLFNVEAYRIAAGDIDGRATIYVSKKRNRSSLRANPKKEQYTHKEIVPVKKIDNFLLGKIKPKFVRMDVEGYEYAILDGMIKTMKELDQLVCLIEVHPDVMTEEQTRHFFKLLKNANLTTCTILHEPYNGWCDNKNNVRPSITFLTKLIGDTEKLGKAQNVSFEYVKYISLKSKRQLRIIFSKGL